jgi:2-dehydropantoate 2-reductase
MEATMQVMVVGAGAVGGFFGAHLAKHHPGVSFLLRPRTLSAVRERGLTIKSAQGTFTVRPQAASSPRDLPAPDLVMLAVKAYDLDETLDQIEPILTDRTVLLTLQNGVDIEERILARLRRDCVVAGVAFIYSKIAEPGVIEHYKRGSVMIGEWDPSETFADRQTGLRPKTGGVGPRVERIADLFRAAGLPCQISENIRRSKWEKMCWNCVFNPLTVIIDDRISKALDHPEMLNVIHQIVGEVAAVASGMQVRLADDIADKVVRWSQEIRDIHTSMYDDWKAGRPTEIDGLNGYIVRRGRELGVQTPLNEAFTAMVKVIAQAERRGRDILLIDGDVIQSITLDAAALAKLPAEHQVPDVGALAPGMRGQGVRVKGLLDLPASAVGVDYVTVHSHDDRFAVSLTLKDASEYGVLVYGLDGRALPDEKGGPFRLITPGLGDACANVKGVGRIELRRGPGRDTRPTSNEKPSHS